MSLTPTSLTATLDPSVFTVPEDYVAGTLGVLVAGVYQDPSTVYTLSDPGGRTVTFGSTPVGWVAGTWVAVVAPPATTPNYLSEDELRRRVGGEARWIELTDDDQDGSPDPDVVAALLDGIDAEINGYLQAGGYTVPADPTQIAVIKNSILDLANYRAKTRGDRQCTDDDRNLFKACITALTAVGTRAFVLEPLPEYREGFAIDSSVQVFSQDSLRRW